MELDENSGHVIHSVLAIRSIFCKKLVQKFLDNGAQLFL